jgi:hypothetical protein
MKRSAVFRRWAGLAALAVLLGAQPATLCGLRCVFAGNALAVDAHGSAHAAMHLHPSHCHGPLLARRRAPTPPVGPTWLPGAGVPVTQGWVIDVPSPATRIAQAASTILDPESPPPRA